MKLKNKISEKRHKKDQYRYGLKFHTRNLGLETGITASKKLKKLNSK